MKVDPKRLQFLADDLENVRNFYLDVVTAEPQIRESLEMAIYRALAQYMKVTEWGRRHSQVVSSDDPQPQR